MMFFRGEKFPENEENPDIWDDSLKFDIYQAMREIVAGEDELLLVGSSSLLVMDYRGNIKYQGDLGVVAKGAVCSGKKYEYIILGENANYQICLK